MDRDEKCKEGQLGDRHEFVGPIKVTEVGGRVWWCEAVGRNETWLAVHGAWAYP